MASMSSSSPPSRNRGWPTTSSPPTPRPAANGRTMWTSPFGACRPQAVAPAEGYRSPAVDKTNFLLEAFFRTEPGHTGGVLLQKKDRAGYALVIDSRGRRDVPGRRPDRFGQGAKRGEAERRPVAPRHRGGRPQGQEAKPVRRWAPRCRRCGRRPTFRSPARRTCTSAADPTADAWPERSSSCAIALGTLDDAKTTIEELYAWQFSGPFLEDFLGRRPNGQRDAGAIEHVD